MSDCNNCRNNIYIEQIEKRLEDMQSSYDTLAQIVSNVVCDLGRTDEKVKSIFDSLKKIEATVEGIKKGVQDKGNQIFYIVLSALAGGFVTVLSGVVVFLLTKGGV